MIYRACILKLTTIKNKKIGGIIMERNVIIDEVFGDDILHLEEVVNEYVN